MNYLKQLMGLLLFLLFTCTALAQTNDKLHYTADLDSLWSRNTYLKNSTTDGKWVTFTEVFDHSAATVWLKNTTNTTTYTFPKASGGIFSMDNKWFGCITSLNELCLINLGKRTQQIVQDCTSFRFSASGEYVAMVQQSTEGKKGLRVRHLDSRQETFIDHVSKFEWHPTSNRLLASINEEDFHQVILFDAATKEQELVLESSKNSFKHFFWSGSGNAALLAEEGKNECLLHYYSDRGALQTLGQNALNKQFPLASLLCSQLSISDDGTKILFYRQEQSQTTLSAVNGVEIWESAAPWIGSKMMAYERNERQRQATVWYPETGALVAIETEESPSSAFSIHHPFALVFNQLDYEPLYKEWVNADLYVVNMVTGEKQLVVKNQYMGSGFVTISPEGKYVAYFRANRWWVYSISTKTTINLTHDLAVQFANESRNLPGDVAPYGKPVWTIADESLLLYDAFDIWLCAVDGSDTRRLTKGRENQLSYRVNTEYSRTTAPRITSSSAYLSMAVDMRKGFLLDVEATDQSKTGYAFWHQDEKKRFRLLEERKIDGVLASADLNTFIFKKQKFNEPPSIHILDKKSRKQRLLFQSNANLLTFDLGRSELIHYDIAGEQLSGTLLYPAQFNPDKKYPMVVYIYEKVAKQVNDFNPPSNYEYIGFNSLKFITDDYFVLYPDITYTVGNPGVSALHCVTAAVDKALENGFIDPHKVGLVGHSFGGYEASFIAGHSNRFAAIVAGAGVTNFTSHYHSVGWNWKQPEIWRYESQQWRMGASYYANKEGYLRNSPMEHVENINTPLLLWTGREDYQVHWSQSVELFMALKRLGKVSKLLLLEKETHFVLDKKKQYHLSSAIKEWFDYYCK